MKHGLCFVMHWVSTKCDASCQKQLFYSEITLMRHVACHEDYQKGVGEEPVHDKDHTMMLLLRGRWLFMPRKWLICTDKLPWRNDGRYSSYTSLLIK